MRLAELSERSGVPVATVKFYVREGILPPGAPVNARTSEYDEGHLERLRLVRGLVHTLGASIGQIREVLSIMGSEDLTPLKAMGRATAALPVVGLDPSTRRAHEPQRAQRLLDELGFDYKSSWPAVRQLDAALEFADEIAIGIDHDQITAYGGAVRSVARSDFGRIPWNDADEAKFTAVLGTAVYEPILLALRRIAHQELGARMIAEQTETDSPS